MLILDFLFRFGRGERKGEEGQTSPVASRREEKNGQISQQKSNNKKNLISTTKFRMLSKLIGKCYCLDVFI